MTGSPVVRLDRAIAPSHVAGPARALERALLLERIGA
jgi:predicted RNA polymerase sigma factor